MSLAGTRSLKTAQPLARATRCGAAPDQGQTTSGRGRAGDRRRGDRPRSDSAAVGPASPGWLNEDAGQLMLAQTVRRAAREWWMNGQHADWLGHTGERLREAETPSRAVQLRRAARCGRPGVPAGLSGKGRRGPPGRTGGAPAGAGRCRAGSSGLWPPPTSLAGLNDVKDGRADLALARLARAVRLAPEHVTLRGEAVGLLTRAVVPRALLDASRPGEIGLLQPRWFARDHRVRRQDGARVGRDHRAARG